MRLLARCTDGAALLLVASWTSRAEGLPRRADRTCPTSVGDSYSSARALAGARPESPAQILSRPKKRASPLKHAHD